MATTMEYRHQRRIVEQWLAGDAISVLERQHGLSYNGVEALIRQVCACEPAMVARVALRTTQQADAAGQARADAA